MTAPILVAGIGNIFLGDDGFGPEVMRHVARQPPDADVHAVDYGIRGMHLAYDLLERSERDQRVAIPEARLLHPITFELHENRRRREVDAR